jgi:hypothetical protein
MVQAHTSSTIIHASQYIMTQAQQQQQQPAAEQQPGNSNVGLTGRQLQTPG